MRMVNALPEPDKTPHDGVCCSAPRTGGGSNRSGAGRV